MSYALVDNGTIDAEQGALPDSARRLDTDEWVMGLPDAPVDLQHATGWYEVVDTPRPPETATDTTDRTLSLVGGVPTVTWVQRPKTAEEIAADEARANHSAIVDNLNQDMTKMQATIDATNATINSNPAPWIKDIARMNRRLGRLALNDLDGSS